MGTFDDLVESATYRLRPDPELRMDVARELRAHLDDAVEAAKSAGATESDAEQQAVREFGDPETIAKKLWEANFRRMRLRSVAKWAGRLVLMPAAILLSLWLTWDAVKFLRFLDVVGASNRVTHDLLGLVSDLGFRPDKTEYLPPRGNLSEEERLLLNTRDRSAEDAEALVREYPADPVYRAHLAGIFIDAAAQEQENCDGFSPATIQRGLAIADDGERVEPDNAFWNYYKAILLMSLSQAATIEEDPDFTYPAQTSDGVTTRKGYRLVFRDREMFERGMTEYRKGLAKPCYRSYDAEWSRRKLALRQQPENLMDELQAHAIRAGTLLPMLSHMRGLARNVTGYARLLIDEGRHEEAAALIQTAAVPGTQLGADSNLLIETLVGVAMRGIALTQGAALYERMGMRQQAEVARALAEEDRRESDVAFYGEARRAERETLANDLRAHGGLIASAIFSGLPPSNLDAMVSLRRAERFFLERAALGVVCLLLLLLVLWFAALSAVSSWRHLRDTRGPKLFFLGWKRLCLVIGVAVVLPLTVYGLWTRLPSTGSANFGINYAWRQVLAEMVITALAVIGLSLASAFLAARKRCGDAGIVRSRSGPLTGRWLLCLGIGMLGFVAVSQAYAEAVGTWGWDDLVGGIILAFLLGAVALVVMSFLQVWLYPEEAEYRASVRRSMLPVLIAILVVLGLVGKLQLGLAERSEIARLNRLGEEARFVDKIEYTSAHTYQEYLRGLPNRGAL